MHDAMFADQSRLEEAALVKTAAGLGLDEKSFESCLKSGKYKEVVQQDLQAGSHADLLHQRRVVERCALWRRFHQDY